MTKLFWRFALAGFAMSLAVRYGGLPWPVGLCGVVFIVCFLYGLDWLAKRRLKAASADVETYVSSAPQFDDDAHEKRMRDLRDELVFRLGFFACGEGKDVEQALSDFKSRHQQ